MEVAVDPAAAAGSGTTGGPTSSCSAVDGSDDPVTVEEALLIDCIRRVAHLPATGVLVCHPPLHLHLHETDRVLVLLPPLQ